MDYARHEFQRTFRRLLAAALGLSLLVAFWADRPAAAASLPSPKTGSVLRGEDPQTAPATEPSGTALISVFRRPWLTLYTLVGAPPLNHGPLSDADQARFRVAVGSLAAVFAALAMALWFRGQRLINESRQE